MSQAVDARELHLLAVQRIQKGRYAVRAVLLVAALPLDLCVGVLDIDRHGAAIIGGTDDLDLRH